MAYTPFDDRFAARNPADNSPVGPNDLPPVTSLLSEASAVSPYWRQVIAADKARAAARVGPTEQRDVGQALDRFRDAFFQVWRGYSGLQGQDALDSYADFSQSLDDARDKVLTGVPGATRAMVMPLLDDMHRHGQAAGLIHYGQQKTAVSRQRIQLAQANDGTATDSPSSNLANPTASGGGDNRKSPDVQVESEIAQVRRAAPPAGPPLAKANKVEPDDILNDVLTGAIGNLNWNIEDIRTTSKSKKDPWIGSAQPEGGFETFTNPEDGVRAAYINLKNNLPRLTAYVSLPAGQYGHEAAWLRSKLSRVSIENIAYLLTVASDNREDWIQKVSQFSGIPRDDAIDMYDVNKVAALLHGIAMKERGESPPMAVIVAGIRKALFNDSYTEVPLEDQRRRLREIARHAPKSGPTKTHPEIPNIRKALDDKLLEIFGYEDLISDLPSKR